MVNTLSPMADGPRGPVGPVGPVVTGAAPGAALIAVRRPIEILPPPRNSFEAEGEQRVVRAAGALADAAVRLPDVKNALVSFLLQSNLQTSCIVPALDTPYALLKELMQRQAPEEYARVEQESLSEANLKWAAKKAGQSLV